MQPEQRLASRSSAPIAIGKPTEVQPVPSQELERLVQPFTGKSIGQRFFGPSGVLEDGTPWIVLVAHNDKRPRGYRQFEKMAMMGWRWDAAPSCLFSLTAIGVDHSRPHTRWLGPSEGPVVAGMRTTGRFLACMANPTGARSGWFEMQFTNGNGPADSRPSTDALESLWIPHAPGIPYSRVGVRFDLEAENAEDRERDQANEIRLWEDPIGDAWVALDYKGPWADDLELPDHKICDWSGYYYRHRSRAAGFIQAIKDRQQLDHHAPLFGAEGVIVKDVPSKSMIDFLLGRHEQLKQWMLALAGPSPDAHLAHQAAFATLHVPEATFDFVSVLVGLMSEADDDLFAAALERSWIAALLDPRITDLGRKRPWLKNTMKHGLELHTIAMDASCSRSDLDTLWRSMSDFGGLLDAGEWLGPTDMPAPFTLVNEALESVRLEGSVAEAKERVSDLLREAQDARQWSIPWGARVQIQFGPFVALRIFERLGEFTCLFLDEQERYLQVGIGLGAGAPKVSSVQLVRTPDDGGELVWNDDAEASLQLIAAAIVRDFLVVEERESVFTSRPVKRRIAGRDVRTVIYLPRVRYHRLKEGGLDAPEGDLARARHNVTHHLRRVGTASAAQRFLAQRYGVTIPEGFTFVRPHERGQGHEQRAQIYRSRSASRMIFEEISEAPQGTRPAWFDFEKDCARILAAEGMRVIHQAANRDGDGGVDLFAVDAEGASWVVQCKCWAVHRPIGPDVVRELVGAIAKADQGSDRSSRGMLITTSTYTSGAASQAVAAGFRIIDGAQFTRMLSAL